MNPVAISRDEAQRFFHEFCRDFCEFDGALVARRYATPYMAVSADGSRRVFGTSGEIADYFQRHLDRYRRQGCASCGFDDLVVVPMGTRSAVASLTWRLLGEVGAIVTSWRESYHLVREANGIAICVSIDHAD